MLSTVKHLKGNKPVFIISNSKYNWKIRFIRKQISRDQICNAQHSFSKFQPMRWIKVCKFWFDLRSIYNIQSCISHWETHSKMLDWFALNLQSSGNFECRDLGKDSNVHLIGKLKTKLVQNQVQIQHDDEAT